MFGIMSEFRVIQQAYRFALAPTPAQEQFLSACCGASRFWWNQGLALVKERLDQHSPMKREASTDASRHREAPAFAANG
jgi:transposase